MEKTAVFFLGFLLSGFLLFGESDYKNLYRLGVAPMVEGGVETVEQVRELLRKDDFSIFLLLRSFNIPRSILGQIDRVEIKEGLKLEVGSRFEAMAFRVSGRIKTTGRLKWLGQEPIEAFSFSLNVENRRYVFIVPKACGNITLWKVEEAEEERKFTKVYISKRKDSPEPIAAKPKNKNFRTELFFDLALGAFRGCHQEYLFERFGLKYRLFNKCFLLISPGVAFPIGGSSKEWEKTYHGDVAIWYDFKVISAEIGVGYSSKVKKTKDEQFEFIANLGLNISERVNLFVEGRLPLKSIEDSQFAKNNHKIVSGIRYSF